jgi:hypothetical protein
MKITITKAEDIIKHTAQKLFVCGTTSPRDIVVACLSDRRLVKAEYALAIAQRLKLGRKEQREVVALASGR